MQNSMYKILMHFKLMERHAVRMEIPHDNLQTMVNWEVMVKARKEASLKLKTFVTKWVSEDTATRVVMVQRKQIIHSTCPMC